MDEIRPPPARVRVELYQRGEQLLAVYLKEERSFLLGRNNMTSDVPVRGVSGNDEQDRLVSNIACQVQAVDGRWTLKSIGRGQIYVDGVRADGVSCFLNDGTQVQFGREEGIVWQVRTVPGFAGLVLSEDGRVLHVLCPAGYTDMRPFGQRIAILRDVGEIGFDRTREQLERFPPYRDAIWHIVRG